MESSWLYSFANYICAGFDGVNSSSIFYNGGGLTCLKSTRNF